MRTSGSYNHVVSVDSVDDEGTDFGLACSGECTYDCDTTGELCQWPGVGSVAIAAKGTAGTFQLNNALHGRLVWDYIADALTDDGALDVSTTGDEPMMVVSSELHPITCSSYTLGDSDEDDVLVAERDASGQAWLISNSGANSCADDWTGEDQHDPAVTPLQDDAFKMYAVEWDTSTHEVVITYYDGTDWETDTATPKFELEDGTVISHKCLTNPATIVRNESGTIYEGMFIDGYADDAYPDGADCPAGEALPQKGIFFAILTN